MTNEEFEKTKEFIIRQQAKFSVDIEKLKERQDKFSEELEKLSKDVQSLTKDVQLVTKATLANTAMIGDLIEAQKRTAEAQKLVAEAQKQTEERLNALINVVEKQITEGHRRNKKRKTD